jgi:hypothetical protein
MSKIIDLAALPKDVAVHISPDMHSNAESRLRVFFGGGMVGKEVFMSLERAEELARALNLMAKTVRAADVAMNITVIDAPPKLDLALKETLVNPDPRDENKES